MIVSLHFFDFKSNLVVKLKRKRAKVLNLIWSIFVVINVIKSSHRQLALPNWRYVILPIGPIKSLAAYQGSCDTISCLPLCLVNANIIPLILYKQENKIKEWLQKAQKRRSSRRTFIRYVLGIVNNFRFMQTAATAERNESIAIFYHKNFRPKIILS